MGHFLSFKGRSGRIEFALVYWSAIIFLSILAWLGGNVEEIPAWIAIPVVALLVSFYAVILFAVTVRRLHDLGFSGWWLPVILGATYFMTLVIGLAGPLVFGLLCFVPGEKYPNAFGSCPDIIGGILEQDEEEPDGNRSPDGRINFKL